MEEIIHPEGKIYYSMGEVCEIFDVNPSLLRFWEEKFSILRPRKNGRGHRVFTPKDVDNIRLIYHLVKEQGMTLEGAQKRIRQNREGIHRDAEIIDRLRGIRNMLVALKEELGDNTEVIEIAETEQPDADNVMLEPVPNVVETEAQEQAEQEPEPTSEPEPVPDADDAPEEEEIFASEPEHEFEPAPALEPEREPENEPEPEQPEAEPATTQQAPKPRIIEQTLF